MKYIDIDSNNYFLCDNPSADESGQFVVPHAAPDSTVPDGMRKPRWTGTWDAATEEWVGGSWVDEEAAELEAELFLQKEQATRTQRDQLLKECDYIMMPDYPLADKTVWETYRQALRDITQQTDFPTNIVWPVKPAP